MASYYPVPTRESHPRIRVPVFRLAQKQQPVWRRILQVYFESRSLKNKYKKISCKIVSFKNLKAINICGNKEKTS